MKTRGLVVFLLSILLLFSCSKKENKTYDARSIQDLEGQKVAATLGSIADIRLTNEGKNVEMLRVPSIADVFVNLESGCCDYFYTDEIALYNVDLSKKNMKICFADDADNQEKAGFIFRKQNTELCDQMNDFLRQIKANGLLDSVFARWKGPGVDTVTMPDIPQPEGTPLKVGVNLGVMPFSFMNRGEWVGIDVELLLRFGQFCGRPVEICGYDFSALFVAVQTGKVDLSGGFIFDTPERRKNVLFSDPYGASGQVCVSRISDAGLHQQSSFKTWMQDGIKSTLLEDDRWKLILEGLWETIVISIGSIILGTLLAMLVCFMRMSKKKVVRGTAKVYISLVRGVPMLVFLMIMFYVIFAQAGISATWVAIIAFALNFAAFDSEVFRSAVESVDKGQYEAGWAMGFGRMQTFWHIIAPQALKHALPIYKGDITSLIKNTSIVGYIAIQDLTKMSDIIRSRTFDAFFPLILITVIYYLLAWLMGLGIEALLQPRHKTSK